MSTVCYRAEACSVSVCSKRCVGELWVGPDASVCYISIESIDLCRCIGVCMAGVCGCVCVCLHMDLRFSYHSVHINIRCIRPHRVYSRCVPELPKMSSNLLHIGSCRDNISPRAQKLSASVMATGRALPYPAYKPEDEENMLIAMGRSAEAQGH